MRRMMDNIKKMGVKLTYRAILAFVGMFSFTPMMCGWVDPKTVLTLRENIQKRKLLNAHSLQEVIF